MIEEMRKFKPVFKALSPAQQSVLKVLSVAYESMTIELLRAFLTECRITNDEGKYFSNDEKLLDFLQPLLDAKHIEVFTSEENLQEYGCTRMHIENIMRFAVIDKEFSYYVEVIKRLFPFRGWHGQLKGFHRTVREMRIALYLGRQDTFNRMYDYGESHHKELLDEFDLFQKLFNQPFDGTWLLTFSRDIQGRVIQSLLFEAIYSLEPVDELLDFIRKHPDVGLSKESMSTLRGYMNTTLLLRGELGKAEGMLEKENVKSLKLLRRGCIEFLKGNNDKALDIFDCALQIYKDPTSFGWTYFRQVGSIFHLLSLLKKQNKASLDKIEQYAFQTRKGMFAQECQCLQAAAAYLKDELRQANSLLNYIEPKNGLTLLIFGVVSYWNQKEISNEHVEALKKYQVKAELNGYRWIAMEMASVISILDTDENDAKKFGARAEILQKELSIDSFISIIKVTERWERSLDLLSNLVGNGNVRTTRKGSKSGRVAWFVNIERRELQPKFQTLGTDGSWSKGRNISLKKLSILDVEGLTEDDHRVLKAIKSFQYGYNGTPQFEIDFDEAIKELVGHPYLFLSDAPGIAVELLRKEPELVVEESKDGFELKFMYDFDQAGISVVKETPTRYIVLLVEERHVKIQNALGGGSLKIPSEAKPKMMEAVGNIAKIVTVQSGLDEHLEGIEAVESDPTIYIHMLPIGNGFKMEFFVKPFKENPPYFKPGKGRKNVITEIEGVQKVAKRNIDLEEKLAIDVEEACPTLQVIPNINREWIFNDPQDCLRVLLEIEPLRAEEKIILEHPKGEKLRLAGTIGFGNMSMKIHRDNDWFGVTGKIQVNESTVLDVRKLLQLMENTQSQFVEIGDGEFIALTETFREQLSAFKAVMQDTEDGLQFHPLAAGVMEEFAEHIQQLEVDKSWYMHLQKLESSKSFKAEVPVEFKAELRDYQEEGFHWLTRLAHWGVGACLADDMGLGKTIQGLALLVERSNDGPAMVIAPASVCRNWLRESERFAPTLKPVLFGPGDREKTVKELGPKDLLIVSYGLVPQEAELLTGKKFNTIILDEAQAIKNRSTQRSKVAMQLQSKFKVITTGTPVENHLGELWNLFNFLNPGLLGGLRQFQENFAIPIEKLKDDETRLHLKKLIQPFILRRRKDDVLKELPSKTEITLSVELSSEERSFYEALRRQAVENIENKENESGAPMRILAEIMRLRQACCHPRMVMADSLIPSSKLKLFEETVDELLAGGHKALVFSQFVKHLAIIRELLEEKGIKYQYLDGQTPLKKREEAINAFQSGDGEVFLISLKAGGVGLNLTAADYVLHLDPWWNPAVEDQASDRAHRIGQKRPVTILRLVAENTIEEKIVKLHHLKRDLADSLLEGTDSTGRMSADQLLQLIKEG